jgi:hypothetical protein
VENNEKIEIFMKVAKIVAKYDIHETIFWHEDLVVFASCNNTFYLGTSDYEKIETEDDVNLFEKSIIDCWSWSLRNTSRYGPKLYAARKRGLRPQGAEYPNHPSLVALFDMCGPKRELSLDNPKESPADQPLCRGCDNRSSQVDATGLCAGCGPEVDILLPTMQRRFHGRMLLVPESAGAVLDAARVVADAQQKGTPEWLAALRALTAACASHPAPTEIQ